MKVVDPRVFQVATQDASYGDVLAHAGNARSQTTNASDDQINLDAGLAGIVQGLDDGGLAQGVEFCSD